MTQVNNTNFKELLPEIIDILTECDFIAFDSEFSGLDAFDEDGNIEITNSLFHDEVERYSIYRKKYSQYIMLQFGISMFVKNKSSNSYTPHTYNFYLYPSCQTFTKTFVVQTSCFKFLNLNHFDFNKWVTNGISYLNESQEDILKEIMIIDQDNNSIDETISNTIRNWLNKAQFGDIFKVDQELLKKAYGSTNVNLLEVCELMKLSFQFVWSMLVEEEILIEKVNEEEHRKRYINESVGFSHVFKAMVKAKKPIIGHNCFSDLCLIYNQFFKKLPESVITFKRDIHRLFPLIYDSKHMSHILRKNLEEKKICNLKSLNSLYHNIQNQEIHFKLSMAPLISQDLSSPKYGSSNREHEAGYDAYITGYVFLHLAHFYVTRSVKLEYAKEISFNEYIENMKKLQNNINLIQAKVQCLNLENKSPLSNMNRYCLHVSSRNRNLPYIDEIALTDLMSSYGFMNIKLDKSGKTALIMLQNKFIASDIMKAFKNNPNFFVQKYNSINHNKLLRASMWCGVGTCISIILSATLKLLKNE